jgi:hypothetical protein
MNLSGIWGIGLGKWGEVESWKNQGLIGDVKC